MKKITTLVGVILFMPCIGFSQFEEYELDLSNSSYNQHIQKSNSTKTKIVDDAILVSSKGGKFGNGTEIVIDNMLPFNTITEGESELFKFINLFSISPLFESSDGFIEIEYLNNEGQIIESTLFNASDSSIYDCNRNSRGQKVCIKSGDLSDDGTDIIERAMACDNGATYLVWEGRRCKYGLGFGNWNDVPTIGVGARWYLFRRNAVFPTDSTIMDIAIDKIRITSNVNYRIKRIAFFNNKEDQDPRLSMHLESNFHKKGSQDYLTLKSKPNSFVDIEGIEMFINETPVQDFIIENDSTIRFTVDENLPRGVYDVTFNYIVVENNAPIFHEVVIGEGLTIFDGDDRIRITSSKKIDYDEDGTSFQLVTEGGIGNLDFFKIGGGIPNGLNLTSTGLINGQVNNAANGIYVAYLNVEDEQEQYISDIIFFIVENNNLKSLIVNDDTLASKISIYPNPTVSRALIEYDDFQKAEIYNSQGQFVSTSVTSELSLDGYNNGTYYIVVYGNGGESSVHKLLKH